MTALPLLGVLGLMVAVGLLIRRAFQDPEHGARWFALASSAGVIGMAAFGLLQSWH